MIDLAERFPLVFSGVRVEYGGGIESCQLSGTNKEATEAKAFSLTLTSFRRYGATRSNDEVYIRRPKVSLLRFQRLEGYWIAFTFSRISFQPSAAMFIISLR